MKITFNTNTPIIHDFLRVIVFKHNNVNLTKKYTDFGYKVSDRIENASTLIWESLDAKVPGVELFFSYALRNTCYMYSEFDNEIFKYKDINELIEKAFERPIDELLVSLLEYYDEKKEDTPFYKNLLDDEAAFYDYISKLEMSDKGKWELYMLYRKPEDILEPLKIFCHRVKRRLRNVYKLNNELIQAFHKTMNVKIKNNPESFVKNELNRIFRFDFLKRDRDIEVTYSLINELLSYVYSTDKNVYIALGIEYMTHINDNESKESGEANDKLMKVFSDKQRNGIFRLLQDNDMYVRQIANEQGMTLSTVSYHIDQLLNAGVLWVKPRGKRIYYSVNKDKVSDRMMKIAELIKDGTY